MRSKYEIKANKELVAVGYRVDTKAGMSRWSENRDFFNLFDLVAISPDKKKIHWISIKGRAGIKEEHRREIEDFKMPKNNIKEIWARSQTKKKEHYWHKVIVK